MIQQNSHVYDHTYRKPPIIDRYVLSTRYTEDISEQESGGSQLVYKNLRTYTESRHVAMEDIVISASCSSPSFPFMHSVWLCYVGK